MAALNGTITFHSAEYRPCYVDGKRALFHRWADWAVPIPGELSIGGAPAGQLQFPVAIVEFQDGEVKTVHPREVRFACNQMFGEKVWFDKDARNEK